MQRPYSFDEVASLVWLGKPSQLIRHKDGTFENVLRIGRFLKRRLFIFVWTENILKTELFRKRWPPPDRVLLQRSVNGKHLIRFL